MPFSIPIDILILRLLCLQIPTCLVNLNSLVRLLAGRLLVDMAHASGGTLIGTMDAFTASGASRRPRVVSFAPSVTGASQMDHDGDNEVDSEDDEDDDDDARTDIGSVATAITIAGMDPAIASKVRFHIIVVAFCG